MPANSRRQQLKLEKKRRKDKNRKAELARKNPVSLRARLAQAAKYPVLHCTSYSSGGLYSICLSRKLAGGMVASLNLLVDASCLGIADVFGVVLPADEYQERIVDRNQAQDAEPMRPEDARKLVEGAIAFARKAGFEPHPDYHRVSVLWGDIDSTASTETFQYGDPKSGLPLYVSTPSHSPAKIANTLNTLRAHCGDQFHYAVDGGRLGDLPSHSMIMKLLGATLGLHSEPEPIALDDMEEFAADEENSEDVAIAAPKID